MPSTWATRIRCNCTSDNLDKALPIFSIRLAEPGKAPLQDLRALYENAFPPEERRPWSLQEQYICDQVLQTLLLDYHHSFAGFVFFWTLPGFTFIEHMAVDPGLRGRGAGSAVLHWMEQQYPRIVLEAEPASKSKDAARRIQFYERLGYSPFAADYTQPAYQPAYQPQPMLLLHNPRTDMLPFERVAASIYEHVYQTVFPL